MIGVWLFQILLFMIGSFMGLVGFFLAICALWNIVELLTGLDLSL